MRIGANPAERACVAVAAATESAGSCVAMGAKLASGTAVGAGVAVITGVGSGVAVGVGVGLAVAVGTGVITGRVVGVITAPAALVTVRVATFVVRCSPLLPMTFA